jgi:hypothetical protein
LIVRKAQSDFQFATIYEQRKTNQLLVAGFTNLAQALDGMGQRIASSIDDLGDRITTMANAVDGMKDALVDSIGQLGEAIEEQSSQQTEALNSAIRQVSTDQIERQNKALEMLDNIQRRRKIYPKRFGDEAY